jgi:beta-glucosidase
MQCCSEGADVRGYLPWSLLDDFEWSSGFTSRLGLYYVDQNRHLKRYARASALWFKDILKQDNLRSQMILGAKFRSWANFPWFFQK